MSTEGGTKAVVAALLANSGIAVAKFVAFLFTGSSSMLAESVHSVADAGNQGLLLIGGKRSQRAATEEHPFGYGRERYFYAFVVAVVLFSLGSLFALYEGVEKIRHSEEELTSPYIAIAVLLVAIVLESLSFRTAIIEGRKAKGQLAWVPYMRGAKAPELPVILLEDFGALIGLVFALTGVSLSIITGNAVWDGIGTLGISLLLGVIAIILILETKSLLLGESASPEALRSLREALAADPSITRVIHMRTQHIGPDELLVAAKVEFAAGSTVEEVASAINQVETRLREAVPIARVIYLEPDLYREVAPSS